MLPWLCHSRVAPGASQADLLPNANGDMFPDFFLQTYQGEIRNFVALSMFTTIRTVAVSQLLADLSTTCFPREARSAAPQLREGCSGYGASNGLLGLWADTVGWPICTLGLGSVSFGSQQLQHNCLQPS